MRINHNQSNKSAGYSLLEVLVVVIIISLFTALSIGYYRSYDEQRKLDGDVKQFEDILNLAANRANSGDLSPNSICPDFQGYDVQVSTANTYSLRFNCGGTYTNLQTYNLQTGNIFTNTGIHVLFKPLTSGTNLTNSRRIRIRNTTINKCVNIQVSPVGVIEELPSCP